MLSFVLKKGITRQVSGERAFTLLELIASMFILSLALAMVVPASIDTFRTYERADAMSQVMSDIGRAQNRAISEGCRVILNWSTSTYNYGCDYVPYDTTAPYAADEAGVTGYLNNIIHIVPDPSSNTSWFFNSRGMLTTSDGVLTTGSFDLQITARDGSGVFGKFADASVLTTGVVTYSLVTSGGE